MHHASRSAAAVAAVVLGLAAPGLSPATAGGQEQAEGSAPAGEESAAAGMAAAMQALLGALPPSLVSYGTTSFQDPARFDWEYRPAGRVGLPLLELDEEQQGLVWDLVGAGLSEQGVDRARAIIELERRLFERTGDENQRPNWYFLTVFATPGLRGNWAWRFEGHHLSMSFTMRDADVIAATPAFFGAQPATSRDGLGRTHAPLGPEGEAARALLVALDDAQRRRAVFSSQAPDDILTGSDSRALRPALLGIRYADLDAAQQELVMDLIRTYASRWATGIGAAEVAAIEAAGLQEVRFGWAGSTAPGEPHYYRVHGPDFIIESGNVDGDVEHLHTVWRKFDDDFGRASLRASRPDDAPPTPTPLAQPPAESEETARAAEAARRRLELVAESVPLNGCQAIAEVIDRRPLTAQDPLPRNFQRGGEMEVFTLRITDSTPQEGRENLCSPGTEIDALSPRHPARGLIGRTIRLDLELAGDGRVSAWQARRIQIPR